LVYYCWPQAYFATMGGEFIPTLDEGDFVIQPVLKQERH
jgi:Cu/Ag efflux pump CusA